MLDKGGASEYKAVSRNLGNIYPYMPYTQALCDHSGWYWLLEMNNIVCLDKKVFSSASHKHEVTP